MSAVLVHSTFDHISLDIRVEREGRRDSSAPCAVINEQAGERANRKERTKSKNADAGLCYSAVQINGQRLCECDCICLRNL